MKKTVFITVLFILVNVTPSFSSTFECESWPYEGIPFFRVKTDTLTLHQKTSSESPVMQPMKIAKGSIVSFQNGVAELIRKRKESGDKSSLIKSTDLINTQIILNESIQKTVKPGIIKAITDGTFDVVNHYGPIKACEEIGKVKFQSVSSFSFKKGDVIEYLLNLGEGQCMMRFKGQVFVHETCLYNIDGLESQSELTQPKTEWWFSFTDHNKNMGWFKMTESNNSLELIETIK